MVLRKTKAKIKLITFSSSVQPAMAGQDDDFSCSMDFGIRQGNIRNTQLIILQLKLRTLAKMLRWRVCYMLGRLWVLEIPVFMIFA